MRVATLLPHPALRPFVVRYLTMTTDYLAPFAQYTGPVGGPALVVMLAGTQRACTSGGAPEQTPPAYLSGNLDRALLTVLAERARCFVIHFTPTGAYLLLDLSVRELTNGLAALGAIAGPDLRVWAALLAEEPNDAARAALTDRVLLARLFRATPKPHTTHVLEMATAATGLIMQAEGRIGVEALARQLSITPRTLLRHFEEAVGLPVRAHARIVRFLAARTYLDHHPDAPWSEVVFRFGYADQSHLIRDFQRYYGEPPSAFRARQHEARVITLLGHDYDDTLGIGHPLRKYPEEHRASGERNRLSDSSKTRAPPTLHTDRRPLR